MPVYALDGVSPILPSDGRFWIAPGAQVVGKVGSKPVCRSGSAPFCAATSRRFSLALAPMCKMDRFCTLTRAFP